MGRGFNLSGLIVAAGYSSRMNSFKPLLKLPHGRTFIEEIIRKLNNICDEVIIVTGFKAAEISESFGDSILLERVKIVHNEKFSEGMFSSLQIGLRDSESDWYLYHFVDQPGLDERFYSSLAEQIERDYDWIQPVRKGRRGHPIIFNDFVRDRILSTPASGNLREVSKSGRIAKKFFESDTEMIFQDIDTPGEYRQI